MPELVAYKSVLVALFLVFFFVAERYRPAVAVPDSAKSWSRIGKNLSLWLINSLMSPLVVIPITLFAVNADMGASKYFGPLGGWERLLFDLLVLDLWIYWWHRANHQIPILWRFHRVHHLDQWLDVTSAVRFHVGEVILSALVRAVVILSLGMPLLSVIVFETLVLVNSAFHHSNIRLPITLEKRLSLVIVTPSIHWLHHHVERRDTDSNYATLFSFWDRMFASRSKNKRTLGMAIGLDNTDDLGLIQLITSPMRR